MKTDFIAYRYPLREVLPTFGQAAEYLHLTEEQQPAIDFFNRKIEELKASDLEAVGGYFIADIDELHIPEGCVYTPFGSLIPGTQVCGYLHGSNYYALFLCTAGQVFREQYDAYNASGDILEAYLVDAIGSMAVENAMDRIQESLESEMEGRGLHITNRYSPGYCNWPITDQTAIFRQIGDNPTGITLNDSCLMTPMKSVSGIIGIGPSVKKRPYGCAVCQNKTCIYRRLTHK